MFRTIEKNSIYEITEKKSKFIAQLMYVENKEEAEKRIKEFKKLYHDARHNCSAYRVMYDGKLYEKSSDDGEPSGTAGAPMLNILKKNNLCNVLIIVTRYFGGILLGTGGLVRCYSDSTIGAIDIANKVEVEEGTEFEVEIDYAYVDFFKYYCKRNNINITNMEYSEKIICKIELKNYFVQTMLNDIKSKKLDVTKIKEICKKFILIKSDGKYW